MPPPTKKRRLEVSTVEEVVWDPTARHDYLTGFHKRKLQRAKHAQEAAEKRARQDKIQERRRLKEERKVDLERHVAEVNAILRPETNPDDSDRGSVASESRQEREASEQSAPPSPVDHEAEYVDEEKYTVVTVEAIDASRDGLQKLEDGHIHLKPDDADSAAKAETVVKRGKHQRTNERAGDTQKKPKKKRKKFRYESKAERKVERLKQKAKKSKQANARRAAAD